MQQNASDGQQRDSHLTNTIGFAPQIEAVGAPISI